jgi:hypothetical protein
MKWIIGIFLLTGPIFSQVLTEAEAIKQLEKLEKLPAANYLNEVAPVREALQNFLQTKKRICMGEFTRRAIDSNASEQKLNEKERKECLGQLKEFETDFIEALYTCRYRYLEFNHAKQLSELTKLRDQSLKDLNKK